MGEKERGILFGDGNGECSSVSSVNSDGSVSSCDSRHSSSDSTSSRGSRGSWGSRGFRGSRRRKGYSPDTTLTHDCNNTSITTISSENVSLPTPAIFLNETGNANSSFVSEDGCISNNPYNADHSTNPKKLNNTNNPDGSSSLFA